DALCRSHLSVRRLYSAGGVLRRGARSRLLSRGDAARRARRCPIPSVAGGAAATLPAESAEYIAPLCCLVADLFLCPTTVTQADIAICYFARRIRRCACYRNQHAGLDWRGLVLQSVRLAIPVHDRRHSILRATPHAAAALAARSGRCAGSGSRTYR